MRNSARSPVLATAALAMLFVGCRWLKGPAPTPSEGEGLGGQIGPAAAATTSLFTEVQSILQQSCANKCHDGRGTSIDDFVLKDDGDLYRRLLNPAPRTVPPTCQNRPLVVPGNPAASLLIAMIDDADGPRADCAERMPHSCPTRRPCLTTEEVKAIRVWIEAGAPR